LIIRIISKKGLLDTGLYRTTWKIKRDPIEEEGRDIFKTRTA